MQEIGTKLRAHKKKAGGIAISIRNNELYTKEWQCRIGIPTQSPTYLAKTAFALFAKNYQWEHPIRSVTVRAINLFEEDCPIQYDLFTDVKSLDRQERLDAAIEQIRFRIRPAYQYNDGRRDARINFLTTLGAFFSNWRNLYGRHAAHGAIAAVLVPIQYLEGFATHIVLFPRQYVV